MPKIYLSLGSNIKPEENLNKAKELLSQEYQLEKESKIKLKKKKIKLLSQKKQKKLAKSNYKLYK